ncbi:MAG: polysulfide reductase NrfD [Candidatus Sumerlaeota bacterium]|nr:polysulfide reductase NrfD [Candidatus Sumerlaeota bacterium]
MLEKALQGGPKYWLWMILLAAVIGAGSLCYYTQLIYGLGITGMSRDVTWGLYIAQFTFLVGVAASAVMVVLPYYLHNYKAFSKITILGEFIAISAVIMCLLFVIVDIGQPMRAVNMVLYPSPRSILFWDMVVLNGYLVLNVVISRVTMGAERKGVKPPAWIRPVIVLSIPWAVSIHTVTAFIYCGLGARPFWLTAILAPRFLASAFSAGPALLILLCLLMRRLTKFDAGDEPIQKLSIIVAYAMAANVFFVALELFTALYSASPEHIAPFQYMFLGLEGKHKLAPWVWTSQSMGILALVLLIVPRTRKNMRILALACIGLNIALWIDKGMAMVVTGFVPSPLGHVTEYTPTPPEIMIAIGIYAIGLFILTGLCRIALSLRGQLEA